MKNIIDFKTREEIATPVEVIENVAIAAETGRVKHVVIVAVDADTEQIVVGHDTMEGSKIVGLLELAKQLTLNKMWEEE